jgi:hypothetical protein
VSHTDHAHLRSFARQPFSEMHAVVKGWMSMIPSASRPRIKLWIWPPTNGILAMTVALHGSRDPLSSGASKARTRRRYRVPSTAMLTVPRSCLPPTRLHVSVCSICRWPRPNWVTSLGQPVAEKAERRGHDYRATGSTISESSVRRRGRRQRRPASSASNPRRRTPNGLGRHWPGTLPTSRTNVT